MNKTLMSEVVFFCDEDNVNNLNELPKSVELLQFGDRLTIPSERKYRDSGEMIAPCTIARTGVMHYKAKDCGGLFADLAPDATVRIMTKEEELFSADSLESFRSCPVTIDHPKDEKGNDIDVTLDNNKTLQKGMLEGLPFRDGSHLAGYIVVNDKEAIDLVDSGIDQTSLGHKSTVVRVHGKEWDAEKTKIRANHVAIVRTGRARTTRISDSEDASINELEAKIDSLTSKLEKEQVMLADAQSKIKSQEEIDKLVEHKATARVGLLMSVARLGDSVKDLDFTGKTEIEIKRSVVTRMSDKDLSNKSDGYIEARFDTLLEDSSEVTLSDALNLSIVNNEPDKKKVSPVEEAKQRRLNRYKEYGK
ncbi:MAG: DUF2213 domain-containing protein [Candidatus Symbiopectobacterium sp. Dall1.0]|nr:DUF2213 domain-containing protein [Candidatus Symbiopectobacterium sp. Dall1.0]